MKKEKKFFPSSYGNMCSPKKKLFPSEKQLTASTLPQNDELATQNDELSLKNDELPTQNDELVTKNDELTLEKQ